MGMNYYTRIPTMVKCSNCPNRHPCQETVHIGKSSYGWRFRFAYNGGKYYKDIAGLKQLLKTRLSIMRTALKLVKTISGKR